jgi:hypothetical protein
MYDPGANDLPGRTHMGNVCLVECENDRARVSAWDMIFINKRVVW